MESPASPPKLRTRALARRLKVIDSDDHEDTSIGGQAQTESEELTTLTCPPTSRASRHGVTATPDSAPDGRRRRRHRPTAASQPHKSAMDSTPHKSSYEENGSHLENSVQACCKTELVVAPDAPPAVLLPTTSALPSPEKSASSPLADITEAVNNKQNLVVRSLESHNEKPEPKISTLERPMDIVIRTRARIKPVPAEPPGSKPRIVISHLLLTNFKSYAGLQEIGPFHASFSSVVGPNGSGKSNVIDSLLFVFGFRASKMRQGKISALIHHSAAHPDLDYCEVAVHFQEIMDLPGGTYEVMPDSLLVISRKAFKNNASKYYINGSESNFTTVTNLLRDRGIDLDHKRFLILQGEVESIAQMKPKAGTDHDDGLLEYLEDIIGTSKYKTPIEEAVAETETLNELCSEKSGRVQHVEKEKKGLEGKRSAALAFIADENELATKRSALYHMYVNECDDNVGVTEEALSQIQNQLNLELESHRDSEEKVKTLERQYANDEQQLQQLEHTVQGLLKQLAKAEKEAVKFEEKQKHLAAKVKKLEKVRAEGHAGASECRAYKQRLSDDLQRNNASIAQLQEQLRKEEQDLAAIRESLKGKTESLSDQINQKQRSLQPWVEKINQKRSAMAIAGSELAILQERGTAAIQVITDAQEKLSRSRQTQTDKLAAIEALKTQKRNLEEEAAQIQAALQKLTGEEPTARSKLSAARQRAEEARASLSNTRAQGDVLTALLRLRDSGRVKGLHGRLGNLGAIDEKYDVAISTACPALDHLVVDSVEVAQQCIEHLRKNNLGRAHFILLDRLASRDLGPVETPEHVPRLFDLVRAKDDKFLTAFYSVLQNTTVAKDLEQANRIAYGTKRWRVVTLSGELIDTSGTMSGGGTRVAKGSMSSRVTPDVSEEQVDKLEKDQESLDGYYQNLKREQQRLITADTELRENLPELETKIQKCMLELESLDRNVEDAQRRCIELGSLQHPSGSGDERRGYLEGSIASLETEIAALEKETKGMEDEIQIVQDKIMEIGGVKLRSQKAKVDGLKEQIDTLAEEIANAEVSLAKTETQELKHSKAGADATAELEGVVADIEKLNVEMQSQSQEAAGSRREVDEAQESLDAKREALQGSKINLDQSTAELSESRGLELELRNKLDENRKILEENQKRRRYWQEMLSKLTMQDVSKLGEPDAQQGAPPYTRDELADLDKKVLKSEIAILEEKLQKITVDLGVLSEYQQRVEEHAARSSDLAEAVSSRNAAKQRCEDLRRRRLEGFMEGFSAISFRLKEMYQMITMGGNAELELVDSLDPFSEGILFSVMPPKKSWKNISNLSGGEKTLSSLALVFALHHYKPTPLYVMDEIDAALDFRNVSIVASYIKERTKNAQFIVISLRNNMFELASRLIGVYKVNHMTKSVTVENRDYINR